VFVVRRRHHQLVLSTIPITTFLFTTNGIPFRHMDYPTLLRDRLCGLTIGLLLSDKAIDAFRRCPSLHQCCWRSILLSLRRFSSLHHRNVRSATARMRAIEAGRTSSRVWSKHAGLVPTTRSHSEAAPQVVGHPQS
jgi:hypothetical protein